MWAKIEICHTSSPECSGHYGYADGAGLAAPQINQLLRLFVMDIHPTPQRPKITKSGKLVIINPHIISQSEEVEEDWEGCLSVTTTSGLVFGKVPRARSIQVTYEDIHRTQVTSQLDDFEARVFQHEYDHLEGVMFLQRMCSLDGLVDEKTYVKILKSFSSIPNIMKKDIAVLPGDGVGPEMVNVSLNILKRIEQKFGHEFTYTTGLVGGVAIDETGDPFPPETQALCEKSDAILFGAIGDTKFDNDASAKVRPVQGLLKMRKILGLYANVRPITVMPGSEIKSPLKAEIIKGVDFVVVRELTGGAYFGEPRGQSEDGERAFDMIVYTKDEVTRVVRFALDLARKRSKKLTVVDKANVLETSRLWRQTVQEMTKDEREIAIDYMFVDNAAMQIIKRPIEFDVIVTENMFGDILTDEASVITGSIGMLPSASIGAKTAMYEPIHGSFPKAKGLNIANPIGTIISAAMMLEYSFGLHVEAQAIRDAVTETLIAGHGTKDIVQKNHLGTKEIGAKILGFIG